MSIQDDVEALEKALAGVRSYDYGPFDGRAEFWTACSPDRIRRLLDALKGAEAMRDAFREVVEGDKQLRAIREKYDLDGTAKLSKAIELLEKWNAAYEADIGDASEYRAAWSGARAFLKDCKP